MELERSLRANGVVGELRALWRLAAPITLAQAGQSLMGLVDTAVVGRVGAVAISGVGLGNGLFFAVSILGIGLVMGLDPLLAQAVGAGQPLRARRLLWQGVWLAVGSSAVLLAPLLAAPLLLNPIGVSDEIARETTRYLGWRLPSLLPLLLYFAVRGYLQASDNVRPILWATIWANVLNLVLDIWLVFGGAALPAWAGPLRAMPAMGSAGAAIATSLCTAFQTLYAALAVRRHSLPEQPADLRRPIREELRAAARVGWPISLHLAAEVGVFALAGLLAGRLGKESLAAHQIALTYCTLTFTLAIGIGSAGSVRVGWAVGARDSRAARRAGLVALAGGGGTMSLFALVFWLSPTALASLMTDQPDVISSVVPLLAVAASFQIFDGLQGVGAGVLRGAGDSRFTFIANMLGHYGLGLPIALVLGVWGSKGVTGLWWGLCVGLMAVAVSLFGRFWRLSSREIKPISPLPSG